MNVAVIAGRQAGKVVLTGQIRAADVVTYLRNGTLAVNPEAQRSLAKGASRGQSTRELIEGDRVHTSPRMMEIVKFYQRVMDNAEKQSATEGFLGAVQLAIPEGFNRARFVRFAPGPASADSYSVGKFRDALNPHGYAGILEVSADLGEEALHIADGQGRCVGFLSLERKVALDLDRARRALRKAEKRGDDTRRERQTVTEHEAAMARIRSFLSKTMMPFVVYAADITEDGTVVGIPVEAERRLYIEGNALNSRAAQEDMLKFEHFSPVILLLQQMRMEPQFAWMSQDHIEEDSKSLGSTSSKLFTLSTLVQAFSRSAVNHTQPIKEAERDLDIMGTREDFVRAFWTYVSDIFNSYWIPAENQSVGERVAYLRDRRDEQNVAFTAVFLQALGKLGYRMGLDAGWSVDAADLGRLDALAPDRVNYVARNREGPGGYDPVWTGALMKPAGEGRWVFNNVSDSVTKTYLALCAQVGLPDSAATSEAQDA